MSRYGLRIPGPAGHPEPLPAFVAGLFIVASSGVSGRRHQRPRRFHLIAGSPVALPLNIQYTGVCTMHGKVPVESGHFALPFTGSTQADAVVCIPRRSGRPHRPLWRP